MKLHRFAQFGEVSKIRAQREQSAIIAEFEFGPEIAVYNLDTSATPKYPPTKATRGGARNRADRRSHGLSSKQVANLSAAACHASWIGLPLNRMITIHWEGAGVALDQMAKATGHYIDLLSKALARHGSSTTWLWVHENGYHKGGHCHILAHIPPDLVGKITAKQKRWLRTISGNPYCKDVVKSRPIGGMLGLESNNPPLHSENLSAALGYVLKGADLEAAAQHKLRLLEPGGCIIGKRCGVSQNIGPKARKACRAP